MQIVRTQALTWAKNSLNLASARKLLHEDWFVILFSRMVCIDVVSCNACGHAQYVKVKFGREEQRTPTKRCKQEPIWGGIRFVHLNANNNPFHSAFQGLAFSAKNNMKALLCSRDRLDCVRPLLYACLRGTSCRMIQVAAVLPWNLITIPTISACCQTSCLSRSAQATLFPHVPSPSNHNRHHDGMLSHACM